MSIIQRDIGGGGRVNGANGPEWDVDSGRIPPEDAKAGSPGALNLPRISSKKFGSDPVGGLDPVQVLAEIGEEQGPPEEVGGLADQLLAWLMPRSRKPDTFTQARIVPLLGLTRPRRAVWRCCVDRRRVADRARRGRARARGLAHDTGADGVRGAAACYRGGLAGAGGLGGRCAILGAACPPFAGCRRAGRRHAGQPLAARRGGAARCGRRAPCSAGRPRATIGRGRRRFSGSVQSGDARRVGAALPAYGKAVLERLLDGDTGGFGPAEGVAVAACLGRLAFGLVQGAIGADARLAEQLADVMQPSKLRAGWAF